MTLYNFPSLNPGRTLLLTVSTLSLVAVLVWRYLRGVPAVWGLRSAKAPPGPPTLPVIGNLHLMPKSHTWIQYSKWANQYG